MQILFEMHNAQDHSPSMGWNFLCAIVKLLSAYATTFSSLPSFCDKMVPTPFGD
jgi:hypothetical protein